MTVRKTISTVLSLRGKCRSLRHTRQFSSCLSHIHNKFSSLFLWIQLGKPKHFIPNANWDICTCHMQWTRIYWTVQCMTRTQYNVLLLLPEAPKILYANWWNIKWLCGKKKRRIQELNSFKNNNNNNNNNVWLKVNFCFTVTNRHENVWGCCSTDPCPIKSGAF